MHALSFFAYLDAGTGSVVIQSLIGIAAGIAVFGRKVFSGVVHKIRSVFSRPGNHTKNSEKL